MHIIFFLHFSLFPPKFLFSSSISLFSLLLWLGLHPTPHVTENTENAENACSFYEKCWEIENSIENRCFSYDCNVFQHCSLKQKHSQHCQNCSMIYEAWAASYP